MKTPSIVRGYGPLDMFLARQRYKIANRKIKAAQKSGRILDIGCGSYPAFLLTVDFSEKYGLDKMAQTHVEEGIKDYGISFANCEIEKEKLPFSSDYFDVVTMLAVFEHIEPDQLVRLHKEIYRILKPGGLYFMTTPAFWTDRLLKVLAKLRLITDVEIADHKDSYSHSMISLVLGQSDFEKSKMQFGYFELCMNNWVTATK